MDRNVARAIKIQTVKVAVGLLLIGGLVGARFVTARRVDPPPAASEPAGEGPLTTRTTPSAAEQAPAPAPAGAPRPRSFFEAMGVVGDSSEADAVEPDGPGRCDLPGQGIQFMRAADCQNLGGAFTPLSKKKTPPED